MRLARGRARQAIERSFSMPLKAAGFQNAKVIARFAAQGRPILPISIGRQHIMRPSQRRSVDALPREKMTHRPRA